MVDDYVAQVCEVVNIQRVESYCIGNQGSSKESSSTTYKLSITALIFSVCLLRRSGHPISCIHLNVGSFFLMVLDCILTFSLLLSCSLLNPIDSTNSKIINFLCKQEL